MLTSVKRGRSKVGYSKAKPLFLITLIDFVPFCKGKEIPFGDTIFADFYKNCGFNVTLKGVNYIIDTI